MRVKTVKVLPRKQISKMDSMFVSKIMCYQTSFSTELTVFVENTEGKETGTYKCLASNAPEWLRKAVGGK